MQTTRRFVMLWPAPLATTLLLISACASPPLKVPGRTDAGCAGFARSRLIVHDLVNTLAQLPGLVPRHTTLALPQAASRLDGLLAVALTRAGYTVRFDSADGAQQVGYGVHDAGRPGLYTFVLNVERVAVRRTYQLSRTGVVPASSLFVRGDDARAIRPDDTLFELARCTP